MNPNKVVPKLDQSCALPTQHTEPVVETSTSKTNEPLNEQIDETIRKVLVNDKEKLDEREKLNGNEFVEK